MTKKAFSVVPNEPEVQDKIVAMLEDLLEKAKDGEINSLMCIAEDNTGIYFYKALPSRIHYLGLRGACAELSDWLKSEFQSDG